MDEFWLWPSSPVPRLERPARVTTPHLTCRCSLARSEPTRTRGRCGILRDLQFGHHVSWSPRGIGCCARGPGRIAVLVLHRRGRCRLAHAVRSRCFLVRASPGPTNYTTASDPAPHRSRLPRVGLDRGLCVSEGREPQCHLRRMATDRSIPRPIHHGGLAGARTLPGCPCARAPCRGAHDPSLDLGQLIHGARGDGEHHLEPTRARAGRWAGAPFAPIGWVSKQHPVGEEVA